jgi:hypothetical protein
VSAPDNRVLLTTLWERTSDKGNEYLSGFLGKARIIGFRGKPTADGIQTWEIYLQPGKEQESAGTGRTQQPRRLSPEEGTAARRRRVQPLERSKPQSEASTAIPLDDDVSDVGLG